MKIKPGATIAGLDIRMRPVLIVASKVWQSLNQELVVTSGLDGTHSPGSLHYYGLALDFRTRYFNDTQQDHAGRLLAEKLGDSFVVVDEGNHIHVQYNMR